MPNGHKPPSFKACAVSIGEMANATIAASTHNTENWS